MLRIDGGTNVTVQDCYFTGQTDIYAVTPITISSGTDVEIANNRIADIDRGSNPSGCSSFQGIYADNCPGLVVRNNIICNIRSTSDTSSKDINSIQIKDSSSVVIKNNIVHHIQPQAPGNASLQKVIFLNSCTNANVMNNTVAHIDTSVAFFINQCFGYWFEYCGNVGFTNNIATSIYSSGWPPPLARGVCAYYNSYVVGDFTDTWDIGPGSNGANYHSGGGGSAAPGTGAIFVDPQYNDPGNGNYEFPLTSPAQMGDPSFVDWDDTGPPSGDPGNTDTDTRSRMGCHGGPGGEYVGLLT
jgi:hypothetical protein